MLYKKNKRNLNMSTYCYALVSPHHNRTYIGVTNGLVRRLRQHNGKQSGGGHFTSRWRPWVLSAVVPFQCRRKALQFEWICKKRRIKRERSVWRRAQIRLQQSLATLPSNKIPFVPSLHCFYDGQGRWIGQAHRSWSSYIQKVPFDVLFCFLDCTTRLLMWNMIQGSLECVYLPNNDEKKKQRLLSEI